MKPALTATGRTASSAARRAAFSAAASRAAVAAARTAKTSAKATATTTKSTATNGNTLLSKLVPPSKLASNLDWRKSSGASILTLNIHVDRIGVRVGHHPSTGLPSQSLDDLPLAANKGKITAETHQQLSNIIQTHNVCGYVVNWPIQHDTGKLGYAAGRVLYTLEQLLLNSDDSNNNRPVCLWDGQHSTTSDAQTDIWGRNPLLGHSTTDPQPTLSESTVYSANVEQYHEDELIVAKNVWDDFVKSQWPEIYNQYQQYQSDEKVAAEMDDFQYNRRQHQQQQQHHDSHHLDNEDEEDGIHMLAVA